MGTIAIRPPGRPPCLAAVTGLEVLAEICLSTLENFLHSYFLGSASCNSEGAGG